MTARKKTVWLPQLPVAIHSPLGDVSVQLVKQEVLKQAGGSDHVAGLWMARDRKILVADDLDPATTWQVFIHEKVHMWLDDAGIELGGKKEEAVCTAIGTAIVSEMIANAPTRKPRTK